MRFPRGIHDVERLNAHRRADALGEQLLRLRGRCRQLLTPLTTRGGRIWPAAAPAVQLIAGLARGWLLHRILRAIIRSTVLRLLVEGVVLPLLVNSRLGQSLRSVVAPPHAGAAPAVRPAGPQVPEAGPAATGPELPTADPMEADINATGDPSAIPPEGEEPRTAPEPLNRAERRAQRRQQARSRRIPRT